MSDLEALAADLNDLGSPYLLRTPSDAREATAFAEPDSFPAVRLADPEDDEMARMVRTHAECRRMPVGRHVSSLVFQRYCHRVCGVAVGAWLRHGVNLDVTAENTTILFDAGTPVAVEVAELRELPDATARGIADTVIERHLLPVARVLSSLHGPGLGNLWGNIAAGFAGGLRTLSHHDDAELVGRHAEELMATRPQLERGGTFRILIGHSGPRLFYDRRTCCHWYAAPDGKYCSWCSKIGADERTARFRQILAEE